MSLASLGGSVHYADTGASWAGHESKSPLRGSAWSARQPRMIADWHALLVPTCKLSLQSPQPPVRCRGPHPNT